jgi:D-serine deaminase-like pyridoxal phosphate-dependent protein
MTSSSYIVGRPVHEADTPVLLVDVAAMERNIAKTAAVLRQAGVGWRPHSKGHKTPAIAHLEIAAGAIGITCAKLSEAEVMVAAGIKSILIANQVVGPGKAARLANLCRQAEVIVGVDSIENIAELDTAGQQKGVRIPVVVEVDNGMHRCGVQPGAEAVALSRTVQGHAGLHYMGLMAWEGQARKLQNLAERKEATEKAVGLLVQSAALCKQAGLPVQIVSCGGTGTEEISSHIQGVTEIQAGNIVLHDLWYASLGVDREFALTLLSTIISRPTPTRLVTDGGKYALGTDMVLPRPKDLTGILSVHFAAEHAVIELEAPNSQLKTGDKLEWIVGYGGTTVILHDEMYAVRDGIVEAVWPVAGRGKLT